MGFLLLSFGFFALASTTKCSPVPVSLSKSLDVCQGGPSSWCQNRDTAVFCGVLELCKLQWSSKDKNLQSDDQKLRFQPSSLGSNAIQTDSNTVDAAPVTVSLYYESLCPGCKQVILQQLYPTYQSLRGTGILKINLVPYGNARQRYYGGSWIFTCQHGPAECTGNVMEACAIKYMADDEKYVPFVHCLEQYGPTLVNGRYCAGLVGVDFNPISRCTYGAEGNSLEHEMGVKTESLNPPHQYVPWLTMNGVHTSEIQDALSSNMLSYVCAAYTGTKPEACSGKKDNESKNCNKDSL